MDIRDIRARAKRLAEGTGKKISEGDFLNLGSKDSWHLRFAPKHPIFNPEGWEARGYHKVGANRKDAENYVCPKFVDPNRDCYFDDFMKEVEQLNEAGNADRILVEIHDRMTVGDHTCYYGNAIDRDADGPSRIQVVSIWSDPVMDAFEALEKKHPDWRGLYDGRDVHIYKESKTRWAMSWSDDPSPMVAGASPAQIKTLIESQYNIREIGINKALGYGQQKAIMAALLKKLEDAGVLLPPE